MLYQNEIIHVAKKLSILHNDTKLIEKRKFKPVQRKNSSILAKFFG